MASAWGVSWGVSWGDTGQEPEPEVPVVTPRGAGGGRKFKLQQQIAEEDEIVLAFVTAFFKVGMN